MKTEKYVMFVLFIILINPSSHILAQWTTPVPLEQVNTPYGDRTPFLSYDRLTLYFCRADTPDFYYHRIYKATRLSTLEPFTEVEEISSLNYSGGHVPHPWVSPDNLRMYYHRTEPGSLSRLKISERASVNDPCPTGLNIIELNSLGNVNNPSLTEDELTIVFVGVNLPGSVAGNEAYIANRIDLEAPFGNVRQLTELGSGTDPFISPDGLTIYFESGLNGYNRIFKATRHYLTEQFGNVEHLACFDLDQAHSRFPAISSDGREFYFTRELPAGPRTSDIYVSYAISSSIYVDANSGDDMNTGGSSGSALATIQKAIDAAADGYTVFVHPGTYSGQIDFKGKAITLQGIAGVDGAPVLENPDGIAVYFSDEEVPGGVLKNLIIKNSIIGILVINSSPTISNVTLVDNFCGIIAQDAQPDISNCIFWNNYNGDMTGCQAKYSLTIEADSGQNNIDADPLFADPNNGDYHLLSERGRYWPEHNVWVLDKLTSPCIDAGDPNADFSDEPVPNGERINMGAYSGTAYASMKDIPNPFPDINEDGIIDVMDLSQLIDQWLEAAGWR
jgi:hypothetical protein